MKERNFKRWLLISLLLNLFLIGGVGGATWRWWTTQGPASAAAQPRSLRFAADELSAEQQRSYRTGLRETRRDAAASIRAAREGREQVLRLLAAPVLDRSAVAAALAQTREADMIVRAGYEARVVDFAAGLSADERVKLASGLSRRSSLGPPPAASAKP